MTGGNGVFSIEWILETERPKLEIITRHLPSRASLLQTQQRSLEGLGPGWVQTLLLDPHKTGVPASHVRLRTVEPWADWVWVLDDDDTCTDPGLLARLQPGPDLYMFRIYYGEVDDLFPLDVQWKTRTVEFSFISPSNIIVSRDLWMQVREAWEERYAGDWNYVVAAMNLCREACWVNVQIADNGQRAYGRDGQD